MLKKEDFINLICNKRKRYDEIDEDAYLIVDKLLKALFNHLADIAYRDLPKKLTVQLFEPSDIEFSFYPGLKKRYTIRLGIPIPKTDEEMDRTAYWIQYILKHDCDILSIAGYDDFDRPDLSIPTDQFMDSTSKLEDLNQTKRSE